MEENQKILEVALDLERQMNELSDRQGELLDPVLDRAQGMDTEELLWWVKHMPPGYHRSEMRSILIHRKGYDWAVEQHIAVRRT